MSYLLGSFDVWFVYFFDLISRKVKLSPVYITDGKK